MVSPLPDAARAFGSPADQESTMKGNDMTYFNLRSRIFAAALTIIAQSAYAQQPPDTVASDTYLNTASGTGALQNILTTSLGGYQSSAFGYGALLSDTSGYRNTAMGTNALTANTTGYGNAAFGYESLFMNTTGIHNTGTGNFSLYSNTSGNANVAFGIYALYSNTTGTNTALGYAALYFNTSGNNNDAVGYQALTSNTTGNYNAAFGDNALQANTTGLSNTASGYDSMYSNLTGANNTAFGANALYSNTAGKGNAAQGVNALYYNTTGIRNLGIGSNALYDNVSGSYNIALGFDAGYDQTTGNDNIYVANVGIGGESQTLRLGAQGTSGVLGSGILRAFVAGVATSQVTGSAVYVTSSGQLGVLASSERFKTDVETMGAASEKLRQLRPVTFKLKTDAKGTVQYGLIAEEVAQVYPELVIHDANGRIDGVRYEELAPMLLNLVQQQQTRLAAQDERNAVQSKQIQEMQRQLAEVKQLEQQLAALKELTQAARATKVRLPVREAT
jgi:hypothetical protein